VTADSAWRPKIDWISFLEAAPYFTQAITHRSNAGFGLDRDDLKRLAPLVRAVCYYDTFDGEVSNGGVMQYFYNQADYLPEFARAPEFVAVHPALADALPFMTAAHAAFTEVSEEVQALRATDFDERVSELFQRYRPRFEPLERDFFAMNQNLRMRLYRAIIHQPHDYLDIEALEGVPATGVAQVVKELEPRGLTCRLRFVDGFPIGPNLLEDRNGQCHLMVRFTPERDHVDVHRYYAGFDEMRYWVDFKTGMSETRRLKDGRLESLTTQRALCYAHGVTERYREDGSVLHTTLSLDGKTIAEARSDPDGRVWFLQQPLDDGKQRRRWWYPSGLLNAEAISEPDGRARYLGCWAEDGSALAPDGNGLLRHVLPGEGGKEPRWREGRLVNGYIEGDFVLLENGKEVSRETYRNGERVER
jgi:uncharacterized protein DUF4375